MGWLFSGRWNRVFELLLFLCIPVVHLCLLVLGWTGRHTSTCVRACMHAHVHTYMKEQTSEKSAKIQRERDTGEVGADLSA